MCNFLSERSQCVVLNDQIFTWTNVTAGVPQSSIHGPILVLICISDLSEGLSTNAKLFGVDTSLFSVIHDNQTSANDFGKDLEMMHNWDLQLKMNFNPTKQAQAVTFSCKTKKLPHLPLVLNNANVNQYAKSTSS